MAQEHFLRCSVNMLVLTISSEDKDSSGPCFLGPWTTEPVNPCLPSCLCPGTTVPLTCRPPLLTHGSSSQSPRGAANYFPATPCRVAPHVLSDTYIIQSSLRWRRNHRVPLTVSYMTEAPVLPGSPNGGSIRGETKAGTRSQN